LQVASGAQTPWLLQFYGQTSIYEQSLAKNPGLQLHLPYVHYPLLLQLLGHGSLSLNSNRLFEQEVVY